MNQNIQSYIYKSKANRINNKYMIKRQNKIVKTKDRFDIHWC